MIFGYEELKESVTEDFIRFLKMNFNEKQMFPAVLNEYEHGKDFSRVENICIHVALALNYARQEWNDTCIIDKLKVLVNDEAEAELKIDLGKEYESFHKDYYAIIKSGIDQ